MAAKFPSHATGKSGEDVVEISTMDVDDDCENVENETSISENESTAGKPQETNDKHDNDFARVPTATSQEDIVDLAVAP